MRKVFLFWSIILLVLIAGAVAIVYSKILLNKEKERADEIKKELVLQEIPQLPVLPAGEEMEEITPAVELPELPLSQEEELLEIAEIEKEEITPVPPPELPEATEGFEIEPLKVPEPIPPLVNQ